MGTTVDGHSIVGASSPTWTGMDSSTVAPSSVVVLSSLPDLSVALVTSTSTAPGPRNPAALESEKRVSPSAPTLRADGEADHERRPDARRTEAPSGAAT